MSQMRKGACSSLDWCCASVTDGNWDIWHTKTFRNQQLSLDYEVQCVASARPGVVKTKVT